MKQQEKNIRNKALNLKSLMTFGQLRTGLLSASFVLLLIAAIFEGFSFGLLVPFLKQAAGMGAYEGWKNIPFLGQTLKSLHFEGVSHRIDLLLCIIVCAVIFRQVCSYVSQVLFYSATSIFEANLRINGYEKLLSYGCVFFDSVKKGEIHNTLMRFTQEVAELMRQLFGLCQNLFFLVIYILVLINVSIPLSLTALAIAPLFYGVLRSLFNTILGLYNKILKQEQKNHGLSFDVFSNIKLVKAMGREKDESRTFKEQELGRTRDNVLAYCVQLLIGPLQEVLMTMGIAVIIWISFAYYFKDDPSFLIKLIVSLLLFRRTVGALSSLFSSYPNVIRRLPFVREYRNLLEPSNKGLISFGNMELDNLHKGIEYRDVSMGYSKNQPVIKDVSFFVPVGSFTAIVGASGTGKSTLVELLPRLYEYQSGVILVDDIPLHEFSLDSLRRGIGFVSQDTLVLNDTIFNNIAYAKTNASEKEVLEAAEKAKVTDFTKKLPEGMRTQIGDKGVKLSGGELQRLSIARVILRSPKILVLDEATSALDSISEKLIQDSLTVLAKGRTTIAIAHRLSTIQNADSIIVMDCGRVVEQGTMEGLMKNKGLFFNYWNTQYKK